MKYEDYPHDKREAYTEAQALSVYKQSLWGLDMYSRRAVEAQGCKVYGHAVVTEYPWSEPVNVCAYCKQEIGASHV
jgi:hypothetical protein